jgi:hypothetical protein
MKYKLAEFLYWNIFSIKTSLIARILNCRTNEVCRKVGPKKSKFLCDKCGSYLMVKSRTNLRSIESDHKKNRATWAEGYTLVCSNCQKIIFGERNKDYSFERFANKTRIKFLKEMPYSDYLQTSEWQEIRKRALKRAYYKCQICNSNGILHVHHRTYERRGEELLSDLIVLCEACHKHYHLVED